MLDRDFKVKGWDTFQSDWNDLLTIRLARAVAIRPSGAVEASARERIDRLLNNERREVRFGMIVFAVSELNELIFVYACF